MIHHPNFGPKTRLDTHFRLHTVIMGSGFITNFGYSLSTVHLL